MFGRHRLNDPLLATFTGADGYEAISIPSGAVLDITSKTFNGERLMEVVWNGRKLLMFTDDLKSTTVPVCLESVAYDCSAPSHEADSRNSARDELCNCYCAGTDYRSTGIAARWTPYC